MFRELFPMLKNNDLIYFDNGATTFKPYSVIEAINDYYMNYTANAHRGDYNNSAKVDKLYEATRANVAKFLNAETNEIVFTSGTTVSLNLIVNGYFENYLNSGDEVLITNAEHASNVLPWYNLASKKGIIVRTIDLTDNYTLSLDNVKKSISNSTKVISIAHITNVIGDVRPIKEIIEFAHQNNILVVIDGAQSVAHEKIDVKNLDIDFLAFSAHKMYGPTGVGVLYGKYELLNNLKPTILGGGMNESFDEIDQVMLKELPLRLEAGTQNIAGVLGLNESIKMLNEIGLNKIKTYEAELRNYLVNKLSEIPHIQIINKDVSNSLITFTVDDIFAQDVSYYLNKYNVCIRAGNHCAKILKKSTNKKNTIRISISFYNTYEEADRLVELLRDKNKIIKEMI